MVSILEEWEKTNFILRRGTWYVYVLFMKEFACDANCIFVVCDFFANLYFIGEGEDQEKLYCYTDCQGEYHWVCSVLSSFS